MGRFSATALLDISRSTRVTPRPGAPVEVQVMSPGSLDVLVARNVSQTGIGIYVSHDFAGCDLDKQVELVITLPSERPFLARGLIKHRTDGGREGHHFGLLFTTITRENRAKIRDYVRFASTN
jgi:hypothetical protein